VELDELRKINQGKHKLMKDKKRKPVGKKNSSQHNRGQQGRKKGIIDNRGRNTPGGPGRGKTVDSNLSPRGPSRKISRRSELQARIVSKGVD